MALGDFEDCTWGAVRLWCARIETDNSRRQVVHELADGDEHPVQDRGLAPRTVRCSVLFVEMPTETRSPMERFLSLKKQVDGGQRLLFTHPLDGSYFVNAGDFRYVIDDDGNLENGACEIAFTRSGEAEEPAAAGLGTNIAAGAAAVTARAAELDALLADLDFGEATSAITAKAKARQEEWETADIVPTRQVVNDVAELSDDLAAVIDDNGLEDDLAHWETWKAVVFMGAAIRAAALAALAETPKVTSVRLSSEISLVAWCARRYGGADALERERQIRALNPELRTPGWIPAGSTLIVPVAPRLVA